MTGPRASDKASSANASFDDGPSLADFLPDTRAGYTAYAGEAQAEGTGRLLEEQAVIDALKTVKDPEIPVNIYDLGLIYDVARHDNGNVDINMSLTAPGCPVAGEMPAQVARAVAAVTGAGQIAVTLVWEPAWTPDRMSEDAKLALDYGF